MNQSRFTIRGLMLAIGGIGMLLGLVQVHTFRTLITIYALALAAIGWIPFRGLPRLSKWGFVLSATGLNVSLFVHLLLSPVFHKAILQFLVLLALVPIVFGIGLAWATGQRDRRRKAQAGVVVIVIAALAVSMIATRWPFRLAFYLSSPELNRLADSVEAGGSITPGGRAGVFLIYGVTVRNGDTVLLVDTTPGDSSGFIRKAGSSHDGRWEWLDLGSNGRNRWTYLDED